MNDKIGIDKYMALKMFYDQGFNGERLMSLANEALTTINQPSEDYYYTGDVIELITKQKELLF